MFYTNKSIRLHNKCLAMLDLIQQANNRKEKYWADKRLYENAKSNDPIRLFKTQEGIAKLILRYETLSFWLVDRYQKAMNELILENQRAVLRMGVGKPQPETA